MKYSRKTFWVLVGSLFYFAVSHAAFNKIDEVVVPCPKDRDGWSEWRSKFAQERKLNESSEYLERCFTDQLDPQLQACMKNVKDYYSFLHRTSRSTWSIPEDSGGFTIVDREYNNRVKPVVTPSSDVVTPELLEAIDQVSKSSATGLELDKKLENVRLVIDSINQKRSKAEEIKMAAFTGFISASDSNSFDRILLFEPGVFPKFINFGLERSTQVSVVAVQPEDATGSDQLPKGIYFKDFTRGKEGLEYHRPGKSVDTIQDSCTACHISGLIQIPTNSEKFKKYTDQAKELNGLMRKYHHLQPAFVDPNSLNGPGYGPVNPPTRTAQFVRQCSNLEDETSIKRIKKAMNCASCHNGKREVKLNYPSEIADMFISEGRMPPHSDLSKIEREALNECLDHEFYGDANFAGNLEKFLTAVDCKSKSDGMATQTNESLNHTNKSDANPAWFDQNSLSESWCQLITTGLGRKVNICKRVLLINGEKSITFEFEHELDGGQIPQIWIGSARGSLPGTLPMVILVDESFQRKALFSVNQSFPMFSFLWDLDFSFAIKNGDVWDSNFGQNYRVESKKFSE